VVGVDVLLDDGTTGQWRRGKVLAIGAEESSGDRLLEGYETIYQLRGDSVPAEIPTDLQHFAGLGVNGDQWFGPSAGSPTYRTFQTAVGACYGGEYVLVQKEISEASETIESGQSVAAGHLLWKPATGRLSLVAIAGENPYAMALEDVNTGGGAKPGRVAVLGAWKMLQMP
jgi:hypothetical protein